VVCIQNASWRDRRAVCPDPIDPMKWIIFEHLKLALEFIAVFGLVLLFWFHPSIQETCSRRGTRRIAYAVGLLFALQAVAQITTRNQYHYPQLHEPFPFTRWAMFAGFAASMESGVLYEWRGVAASGAAFAVNPARLYLTPNAVVLFTKTHSLADQLTNDLKPQGSFVEGALAAFAEGIMSRYNRLYPGDPLVKLELWKRSFPLQMGSAVPEPFTFPHSELVYNFSEEK